MTKIEAGYVLQKQLESDLPGIIEVKKTGSKKHMLQSVFDIRMCGFSDSSQQVRSWDEFMEEN